MEKLYRKDDNIRLSGEKWAWYPGLGPVVVVSQDQQNASYVYFQDVDDVNTCWYVADGWEVELVASPEEVKPVTWLEVDAVSPEHYVFGDSQVIDITRHLDFLSGNVVKYVARAGRKGKRLEDLFKAREYLNWLIEDAGKE